jgi:GNAT superfamily N-acetyltransferase
MAEITVGKARPEDLERLADAFADAFAEDPIFGWLLERKPHRDRRLLRFFRILLREELRQSDHETYLSQDGSGGAIWKGIDRWKTPPSTILRQTPGMALAFGPGNSRPWKVLGAMEKVHPREPHYYLETLGTKQAVQGKGVGSAVMSLMLERCDREGVPAYLESSNPKNIPLYARHGFEVRDPVPLPAGAPVLTPMWREPRAR